MRQENMKQEHYKQKAWVVFTNQTDLPWLRVLRPGFRHCFVILHDGRRWLSVDPLAGRMEIQSLDVAGEFDLPRWLEEQGHIAIRAKIHEHRKLMPLMPLTCVEVVKRVLGIKARSVITPWQLYRHIRAQRYQVKAQRQGRMAALTQRFTQFKGVLSWEA